MIMKNIFKDKKVLVALIVVAVAILALVIWKFFPVKVNQVSFGKKFQIVYNDSSQPRFSRYEKLFKESVITKGLEESINKYNIEKPFKLVFGECGKQDFYFDEQKREVRACYEMVDALGSAYTSEIRNVSEYDEAIVNSTYYLILHNIAHVAGNYGKTGSEGKVNELGEAFALGGGDQCFEKIFTGGLYFVSRGDEQKMLAIDFNDERSTDLVRFIEYACVAYGKDPKDKSWLIDKKVIDESKALQCGQAYAAIKEKYKSIIPQ